MSTIRLALLGLGFVASQVSLGAATTRFISPAGNDHRDGRTEDSAWKTFAKAFSSMGAGDELVLLDGPYSEAAGTGYINFNGANSAQIPSGKSLAAPTWVHAKNPGKVKITGMLVIGTNYRKDSYIKVQGITFEGGGWLLNTSYVTVKECGFHDTRNLNDAVFGIGTNDHAMGNSYNLVEDCWVWGRDRIIAIDYRSDHNVWRRVVVRGDGCSGSGCAGSGNPNVGITVYESAYISLQNVIVLDRILDGGSPYADFAVAQHTPGMPFGRNEWLGTLSLKSPDLAYYFEPDEWSLSPTFTLKDCMAWEPALDGIGIRGGVTAIRNCTVKVNDRKSDGIYVRQVDRDIGVRNVIVTGSGRIAVTALGPVSYADISGTWAEGLFDGASCSVGCKSSNPLEDGSIRYLPRIEPGSALSKSGDSGADYGANLVYRYGVDGSRSGQANFNLPGRIKLWPWPNQDRIKKEMCSDTNVTRGFCSKSSLTEYVWSYLGNGMPAEISRASRACDINGDGAIDTDDVQAAIQQALGIVPCNTAALREDGRCNVIDVQRIINASMGGTCIIDP